MAAFPVVSSEDEEYYTRTVLDDALAFTGLSAEEQVISMAAFADADLGDESETNAGVDTFSERLSSATGHYSAKNSPAAAHSSVPASAGNTNVNSGHANFSGRRNMQLSWAEMISGAHTFDPGA
eukprot:4405267-Pleurochrysis_carterae.AAC.1